MVERSREWRQQTRNDKTREYFYGTGDTFSPASQVISFDDVIIYRVGGGPVAPATALPVGQKSRVDPVRLTAEHPSTELVPATDIHRSLKLLIGLQVHSILAVSHAQTPDDILATNIAGFVHVYVGANFFVLFSEM